MRTRLAPTPSGFLHAGNGAAFVLASKLALEAGGKLLLRIDDLDTERVRPEYVEDIFQTLEWLGIVWDEGPKDADELERLWSQRNRLGEYLKLLGELRGTGQLYACTCSRKEVVDRTGTTEYDGHCRSRKLDLDMPEAIWRLRLPEVGNVDMKIWPDGRTVERPPGPADPVVRQRNGRPAYHIASLADDLLFKVDVIVRGTDLLASTMIQLHIAQLLGLSTFNEVLFLHHPLHIGVHGEKLSKSAGATSLRHQRESGQGPETVNALAEQFLAGFLAALPT